MLVGKTSILSGPGTTDLPLQYDVDPLRVLDGGDDFYGVWPTGNDTQMDTYPFNPINPGRIFVPGGGEIPTPPLGSGNVRLAGVLVHFYGLNPQRMIIFVSFAVDSYSDIGLYNSDPRVRIRFVGVPMDDLPIALSADYLVDVFTRFDDDSGERYVQYQFALQSIFSDTLPNLDTFVNTWAPFESSPTGNVQLFLPDSVLT